MPEPALTPIGVVGFEPTAFPTVGRDALTVRIIFA